MAGECGGGECLPRRVFIRLQQTHKLCLFQNQPFGQAPRTATPLVLEVNPMPQGIRVPKGVPEHREMIAIRDKPDDILDADPLRIAALKPVRDAQRVALALAPTTQQTLIPTAGRQLIPDEGRNAP